MKKIFVSGCYDIIHAGHIQFFNDAKKLGNHLTVCFASNKVLKLAKGRNSSIPEEHKVIIISSLKCVDTVVMSSDIHPILDFKEHLIKGKYDVLAVTEDDKNIDVKRKLCERLNMTLVILPKKINIEPISTSKILAKLKNIIKVPLRIDFAGGWLDVPAYSKPKAYIVNCSISPLVSLDHWEYEKSSGLGGSAAYSMLQIKNSVESELKLGVGWQDPAIITETGLCVWRSGKIPVLELKQNPDWLNGKLLLLWTGSSHNTPNNVKLKRDYSIIVKAGILAKKAVEKHDIQKLAKSINTSYKAQIKEGMDRLPKINGSLAAKYLGGGHGGYALYLFKNKKQRDFITKKNPNTKIIEPYIKPVNLEV
jgi:cytidyltransferase-like protein